MRLMSVLIACLSCLSLDASPLKKQPFPLKVALQGKKDSSKSHDQDRHDEQAREDQQSGERRNRDKEERRERRRPPFDEDDRLGWKYGASRMDEDDY